jgi:hypothetical protein
LLPWQYTDSGRNVHFFLLGAGFLLLETRAITQLSLLFGSTWVVSAVVIGAFLCMALLSNLLEEYVASRSYSLAALLTMLLQLCRIQVDRPREGSLPG